MVTETTPNIVHWATSWLLFWLGCAIARPMEWFDAGWMYPPYNRVMLWSSYVQGEGSPGPWGFLQA